jgi:hypothetical protein
MAPAASEPFALPSKDGAGCPFAESPQLPGTSPAPGSISSRAIRTLRVATAIVMGRAAHFRTRDVKRRPFLAREAGEPIELHPILGVARLSIGKAGRRDKRRGASHPPRPPGSVGRPGAAVEMAETDTKNRGPSKGAIALEAPAVSPGEAPRFEARLPGR